MPIKQELSNYYSFIIEKNVTPKVKMIRLF